MKNVNILTLFYSLILFFNILFSIYSRFVIISNKKVQKSKTQQNVLFQNPYTHQYYIYNNLKTKLKPYGIEN